MDALLDPQTGDYAGSRTDTLANAVYLRLMTPLGSWWSACNPSRVTMLPQGLVPELRQHLDKVKTLHAADLAAGLGAVYLPYALERKYPAGGRDWAWQYVFPAAGLSVDPRAGAKRRHPRARSYANPRGAMRFAYWRPTACTVRTAGMALRMMIGYTLVQNEGRGRGCPVVRFSAGGGE